MAQIGKYLIIAGTVVVILGIIVYFFGGRFGWFGNLPGDLKYEHKNVKVFFPITTMVLISLFLSLLFWAFRKFF